MGYQRHNGVQIGEVYRITKPRDLERLSMGWLHGRLKLDDLIVPVRHTGDCHYSYLLIWGGCTRAPEGLPTTSFAYKNFVPRTNGGAFLYESCHVIFSSYTIGEPYEEQPTAEELSILLSGRKTVFSVRVDPEQARREHIRRADDELHGMVDRAVDRIIAERSGDG